jgi:plasmid maintenance system antidote protein VapI
MITLIKRIKGLHPGLYVERELRKRGLNKSRFALEVGEYPQTFGAITLGKRRMNVSLALRIERLLGLEEGLLMVLQVYHDIENEKSGNSNSPDLRKFRKVLFWDTDLSKVDWMKQKRAIIRRVFERGNTVEREEIIQFYGEETVRSALKRHD